MNKTIENGIEILQHAINKNISAKTAAVKLGYGKDYVYDIAKRLDKRLKTKTITKEEYNVYQKLYDAYLSNIKSVGNGNTSINKNNNSTKSNWSNKVKNVVISNSITILNHAIKNNTSAKNACRQLGFRASYIFDAKNRIDIRLKNKSITQQEYDIFFEIYNKYNESKSLNKISKEIDLNPDNRPLTADEKAEVVYDAYADDKYDSRSISENIRDSKGKIESYYYKILIRDEPALEGYLSRTDMERVYSLYSSNYGSNLTMRAVSRDFSHLTFRDFKRIMRAFNITKASIPCAPHTLEEQGTEKVAELVFQNKENNLLKYLELQRSKYFEQSLMEAHQEILDLKHNHKFIADSLKEILSLEKITPYKIEKKKIKNEVGLFVYISDAHVGAHTEKDSIYNNDYNAEVFNGRLTKVLEKIKGQYDVFGHFDKVYVFNMGDCLDGFDAQTVRGGHSLPQNLNNKEQFNVYVQGMIKFLDTLHKMKISNQIEFISVGDDNHSGDFGYIANKTLEYVFKCKYPDMKVRVFEKFIEHITYGQHTFLVTHGKDSANMRAGFPLHLDNKTETYFNEYINNFNIKNPYLTVLKGDLHQSSSQQGKRFRYKNVSSLYGGSDWMHTNFGYTRPAVDFDIVFKNEKNILEGTIDLR